jgi:hypothetical protein
MASFAYLERSLVTREVSTVVLSTVRFSLEARSRAIKDLEWLMAWRCYCSLR